MYSPSFPARYDRNSVRENCIGFTGIRERVNNFWIMDNAAHTIFAGHHHGVILWVYGHSLSQRLWWTLAGPSRDYGDPMVAIPVIC
jgi:hypothetical protein